MNTFTDILAVDAYTFFAQSGMVFVAVLLVFLVLFTTRDIILRTGSFFYQLLSIVLVAALPVIGFFIYLLIRPARTRRERRLEADIRALIEKSGGAQQASKKKSQSGAPGFKMGPQKIK